MDRKRIVLSKTSQKKRNELEALHGYNPVRHTMQLNAAIISSPEYTSWEEFFGDLRKDFRSPFFDQALQMIWVPRSEGISDAERRFEQYRENPDNLIPQLLEPAHHYGNVVVQYGPPGPFSNDKLAFRIDREGTIYCVRARIVASRIGNYTTRDHFRANMTDGVSLIFAYYHELR